MQFTNRRDKIFGQLQGLMAERMQYFAFTGAGFEPKSQSKKQYGKTGKQRDF